jgi:hypothetical protein
MEFFLNQLADVGSRITWTDKRYRRFLFEIKDLFDFKGEINNSWGMYSLYIHSNGRTMRDFIDRLVQYGINIDSADRGLIAFPNPFQFNITFNPANAGYTIDSNGNKVANSATSDITIQRKYKDIKYLKLETVTLPNNYTIKQTALSRDADYTTIHTYYGINYTFLSNNDVHTIVLSASTVTIRVVSIYVSGSNWTINYIINDDTTIVYEMNQSTTYNKYSIDTATTIIGDRLFYIYIPEITSYIYTTNSDKVTFIATCVGTNSYTVLNNIYPPFIFYKDSILQNALKYTVKITDRYGNQYVTNNLDTHANTDVCNCQTSTDYSCRCSYIRNPYYIKLQVSLQFKFGIFEDDLYKDLLHVHPRQ